MGVTIVVIVIMVQVGELFVGVTDLWYRAEHWYRRAVRG